MLIGRSAFSSKSPAPDHREQAGRPADRRRIALTALLAFIALGVSCLSAHAQMSAEDELKTLQVPEGFEASLFAAEPLVINPSAIDIDTKGRVWVAEIQWYRAKAKQPPADSIKVLEDTDGDGKADKVTVFAEGIFAPMSICVAGSKVFVATSPDLWMFEDKDGDLKADGPPTKLLTGFGGFNHDHGAHSLVLGPDHKWWMSHGDTGFDVKGVDGSQIKSRWGAMIRGELDGSKLEVVAENFRNPYELAVSSTGEVFCSDNDNDGNFSVRICWILEGGNYGWFGGPPFPKQELDAKVPPGTPYREAWHFRGHVPGFVPGTLVTGFGSPCGMCFYEGDAFGPKFTNVPLHCDAGPREVRAYPHKNAGYGMEGTIQNLVTTQGDNYFRPDDICAAPDGSLYLSDWYDGGVGGHGYNDPDRGRIFRLTPKGKKVARREKPGPYANVPDAIEGLRSPNLATQFLARERLLAEGEKSIAALVGLVNGDQPTMRARALWVLDRIGGSAREAVVKELTSKEASRRALAARILRRHGATYAAKLLPLADDDDAEVRREVTLALRTLEGDAAFAALVKLAARYDGRDRYELEALNAAAGSRKEALYNQLEKAGAFNLQKLALMQLLHPEAAGKFLAAALEKSGVDAESAKILLTAASAIDSPEAGRSIARLVANEKLAADLRLLALDRLAANLGGSWKGLAEDETTLALLKKLLADERFAPRVLTAAGDLNLAKLGGDVRDLARSPKAAAALRTQAIVVAGKLRVEGLDQLLAALLKDEQEAVRGAALASVVDRQDARLLRAILAKDGAPAAAQSAAVERLMGTAGGAIALLRLIDEKLVAGPLKESAVKLAENHADSNVRVLYERYIPADRRPKRLGEAIKAPEILALSGDAARGEQIFFQSTAAQCKNCHRVQGKGATLGPDLSQIGKKYERAALLETILEPSKAIAPEYQAYIVETDRGQIFVGFLVERTDQQITLRDAKDQLIRVAASEVVTLEKQDKSLMPELVLRDVTAQDAADLLAYLSGLKQGVVQVDRFRVLGPLDASGAKGLDQDHGIETTFAAPDLTKELPGLGGKPARFELVPAQDLGGYLGIDTVKLDQSKGLRAENVAHYFLVQLESAADQQATLNLGSDDGCKVWLNGKEIHKNPATRALGPALDRVAAQFKTGRNTLVIKVVNGSGPGGVTLSITAGSPIEIKTQ